MKPIITTNDTTIEIKIIDEKGCYYKTNIPNNDINKKLIENPKSNFKFDKCGSGIIMHDDIHVFQLSKMECNYSDYIEMQNKLENTEKEVILLKQELSKNEKELVNFKNDLIQEIRNELFDTNKLFVKEIEKVNDKSVEVSKDMEQLNNNLQQQINIASYYSPVVFTFGNALYQYYGDEPCTNSIEHLLNKHQMKLINGTKLYIAYGNQCLRSGGSGGPCSRHNYKIIIPQKKTVILFKGETIEIYSSGIHNNIEGCNRFWCGKEDDKDEFINTLNNIGYNCDNIIKY